MPGEALRDGLRAWLQALRLPFAVCTLVPVVLGALVAWARTGAFQAALFSLALMGAILLNLGANLIDDYFSNLTGTDAINVEFIRPFSGGSRVIQERLLRPQEVLAGALACLGAAAALGVWLAGARGATILWLGAIGLVSAVLHASPGFSLSAAGLGEPAVGLNFGVLATVGSYYVQARDISLEVIVASLPLAAVVTAMLWINEFPDVPADAAVGRRNLVVRLGRRRAVRVYAALVLAPYVVLALGTRWAGLSPFTLAALPTAGLALLAAQTALAHYGDSRRLARANALTRQLYLSLGLAMIVGYAVQGLL